MLNSFLPRGWVGNSPIKKIALRFCPGGLELTDTLISRNDSLMVPEWLSEKILNF